MTKDDMGADASSQSGVPSAEPLHCSFCDKDQYHVKKLIAGPRAFICDDCVSLCNDVISDLDRATSQRLLLIEQRLESFAKAHKIKSTLGLLGEMTWVLGLEFDFKLTSRSPAQGMETREGGNEVPSRSDDSPVLEEDAPND